MLPAAVGPRLARLAAIAASAPPLDEDKLEQIAALPAGLAHKSESVDESVGSGEDASTGTCSAPREKMAFRSDTVRAII